MTNKDIFSMIQSRYPSFTNAEKKVADYILKHPLEIIYMSITDLADACNVGDTSVFRFCRTLSFKGYQEFRIALAHSTSIEDETPQLSSEITMQDTIGQVASKVLSATTDALSQTHNLMNEKDVLQAIEWMINSERIHFFGVGASLMTAMEGKNKFMRITNKTECSMDSHLQAMSASLLTENDVGIVISYSGSTKDTIEVAKILKERGTKVISITRFAKSPLTIHSDVTLLCGANEGPLQGGSLSAKISQLYLLDILYAEYFKRTNQESIINKEKTADAVTEKLL